MGRLASLALWLVLAVASGLPAACATPRGEGFHYTVRRGDNVYRIGRRFGVPTETLVRVNRIRDVRSIRVGSRLWIPVQRSEAQRRASLAESRQRAKQEARRSAKLDFQWPLRGELTSRFGSRNGRPHEGIDLSARRGRGIRAAEAGKVIHSGRLRDYGKVVILKHTGNFRTVYAHASRLLVRRGEFVRRGQKIAEVGSTGNASGAHLHFEVRVDQTPRDPMLYLP